MNSELFNKWTSVLANIGVLVGLAIVIIELAQNTRAIESEVAWARLENGIAIQNRLIDNPEFAELYFRITSMEEAEFAISDSVELQRVARHIITTLLYFETRFITQTTDSERLILRDNVLGTLSTAFAKDVATNFNVRNANARNPEFRIFLADMLSISNAR